MRTEHVFEIELTSKTRLNYLLYLPDDYDVSEDDYPLLLFLHGMGERGDDLKKIKTQGLPARLEKQHDLPFIVVAPECPLESWWDFHLDTLMSLLDVIVKEQRVDTRRIYLTGLSMGGFGTWGLASLHPDRFAAIAPICGGLVHWVDLERAVQALKTMPIWTFHGAKDTIVPISQTERLVDALRMAGSDVRFTVYPNANHDSWTETYANPALYDWLLSHTLTDA